MYVSQLSMFNSVLTPIFALYTCGCFSCYMIIQLFEVGLRMLI